MYSATISYQRYFSILKIKSSCVAYTLSGCAPKSSVFVVGVFGGYSKPLDVHAYLEDLITELKEAEDLRWQFNRSGFTRAIKIASIIYDAPARGMAKQVKPFYGYYGYEDCIQRGVYKQ